MAHEGYQRSAEAPSATPRAFGLLLTTVFALLAALAWWKGSDRQVREQFLTALCERLDAAPVQHIGKLLVIWRPHTDDQARAGRPRPRRREPRRSKRSFQGS